MNIRNSRLSARDLDRQSLSLGLRIRGNLSEAVSVEGNISDFRILKDITYVSAANPAASDFTGNGQATDFDDTGWQTFDVKLNAQLGEGVALVTGGRYERYRLHLSVFESDRWHSGENNGYSSRSGGEAEIGALFSQLNWDINAQWRAAIGLRYEDWRSHSGYYSDNDESTPEFDLVDVPSTEHSKFSPKFSLAYQPNESWLFRYSYGQAYRFPIVEELFSQYQAYNSVSEANPVLKPEDGKHQNLMLERSIEGGYLRVNVFQESIRDVIESQSTILPGGGTVRTFSAIDQVDTSGVEFIVNQHGFMRDALDIRFNLSYLDSTIVDNSSAEGENPAATIEGNDYPRMPHWRSNVMATYHLGDDWSASANVQYASNSFGRPDNLDTEKNVMGAQDGYTRIGVRTAYAVTKSLKWALGVDNIINEIAYVAHPWPGRTVYMSLSYQR
jgi:Outer membrane receptor proteins, mostly Fe transport